LTSCQGLDVATGRLVDTHPPKPRAIKRTATRLKNELEKLFIGTNQIKSMKGIQRKEASECKSQTAKNQNVLLTRSHIINT